MDLELYIYYYILKNKSIRIPIRTYSQCIPILRSLLVLFSFHNNFKNTLSFCLLDITNNNYLYVVLV